MTNTEATETPRGAIWLQRTEYPLAVAALLFLGAYAWPILDPAMEYPFRRACEIVVYVMWALFVVDYFTRLALAERKASFVGHNLIDLIALALPVLRPLRLLRLVALVRILNRKATVSLHGRVAIYVGFSAVLIIFVAALAVLDAERGKPHANINGFGDALWWSATTVTTVGYGDRYPLTETGRFVAVGLMLGGIALIGVVTASIASWLIARVRDVETSAEYRLSQRLEEVHQEIAELKKLVVAMVPAVAPRTTEAAEDSA